MKKAELLLTRTDLSIKEVASIIGFNSTGNFYKAFKKYFKILRDN